MSHGSLRCRIGAELGGGTERGAGSLGLLSGSGERRPRLARAAPAHGITLPKVVDCSALSSDVDGVADLLIR